MTIKEKLDAIKVLLSGTPIQAAVEPAETEPSTTVETEKSTATAKDGTIVKWDGELMVGSEIMVTTPEGDKPAPDGSIEFEDGTILTTVSGKVTQITPAMAPAEMSKENESLKAEIETLKSEFASHKTESTEQLHKLSKAIADTLDIVNELNKVPTEPQPKPINALFSAQDHSDRLKELSNKIKSLKK